MWYLLHNNHCKSATFLLFKASYHDQQCPFVVTAPCACTHTINKPGPNMKSTIQQEEEEDDDEQ